jgi:hypothetical protein
MRAEEMTEHEHDPATDPPGAQSDQNGEEAQSGHREDGTHPEPRTSGTESERHAQYGDSDDDAGEDS